jgi:hypothetical protein
MPARSKIKNNVKINQIGQPNFSSRAINPQHKNKLANITPQIKQPTD